MLPTPMLALLAAAFPGDAIADLAPTQGGFSHLSALATIGGRRCCIKAADAPAKRAALRHEAALLHLLAAHRVAAPTLLAWLDDADWSAEVLAALPGVSGVLLYAAPPTQLQQALGALAARLATIHTAPLAPPASSTALPTIVAAGNRQSTAGRRHSPALLPTTDCLLALRAQRTLAQIPTLALPPGLRTALAAALGHPAWQPITPQLIHGDAGLHNLLWAGAAYTLIDWEWAGWGSPLLDLAWVWWTLRWRQAPEECWAHFLASYRAARPIEAPERHDLHTLALGQIALILVRVCEQPAPYAEWLRRAAWTLGLTL